MWFETMSNGNNRSSFFRAKRFQLIRLIPAPALLSAPGTGGRQSFAMSHIYRTTQSPAPDWNHTFGIESLDRAVADCQILPSTSPPPSPSSPPAISFANGSFGGERAPKSQ